MAGRVNTPMRGLIGEAVAADLVGSAESYRLRAG
jgi:hypothetical protein